MADKIRGDVPRKFVENVDFTQAIANESIASSLNTFGDAFTVLAGRTLRFDPRDLGLKNYSTTLPNDKQAKKTQQLANRTLPLMQAPEAPNLAPHSKRKTRP